MYRINREKGYLVIFHSNSKWRTEPTEHAIDLGGRNVTTKKKTSVILKLTLGTAVGGITVQ